MIGLGHGQGRRAQRFDVLDMAVCEEGMTEDKMVGWNHRLNGHEFEQALGDGEAQGRKPGVLQSTGLQRVGHN